ncbi:ASPIC/UnbV domain-containing protein [Maricaulaceae bacterium NA33B04]|nr:ASPIC/UnbV domain-containing protein [Maricaulaceae bacterium NA33B04]
MPSALARSDGSFTEMTEAMGLMDYHMTAAAVVVDLDNDGDLDMVTAPVNAPAAVFVNNATDRNALSVQLIDRQGNRDGIGARLTLYGGLESADFQVRELQLGGGFMSFDDPVAHFGLDAGEAADRLEIRWADGSTSQIAGPFEAGGRYTLTRHETPLN